ncbi:MAG: S8 family serine peptidase [candidate division Zixibacteria bacterium]|nr:S8 family serine peptidase [Candidatus Tariuqbacter arcticus]
MLEPDDHLAGDQWHLDPFPGVNAEAAWDSTTGDTLQIIGIIDTGVDWDHPDLAEKIWLNYPEYNGVAGVDDDGNGFVDDIREWDWINEDNDPNDDNCHGTHVAGIAAAESNNGIGVAGISWGAKIMPLKVLQSTAMGR